MLSKIAQEVAKVEIAKFKTNSGAKDTETNVRTYPIKLINLISRYHCVS